MVTRKKVGVSFMYRATLHAVAQDSSARETSHCSLSSERRAACKYPDKADPGEPVVGEEPRSSARDKRIADRNLPACSPLQAS